MKKIIIITIICTLALFSLAGCFGATCTNHTDANGDGKCDTCQTAMAVCQHVDINKDTSCDKCGAYVAPTVCTEHTDSNNDNTCDNCGFDLTPPPCTEHTDTNNDNTCDNCGADLTPPPCTEHKDENLDGECDECGAEVPLPEQKCEVHIDEGDDGVCDSCNEEYPLPEIDLSKIVMESKTVAWNGEVQYVAAIGTRPKGISVVQNNNRHSDVGEYTATAAFYFTGEWNGINYSEIHLRGKDLTATLKITKADYDLSDVLFEDVTVTYDKQAHSITIPVDALPEGLAVSYEGNEVTNAGVYTVTATFTPDANHNSPAPMTATLTINKAVYDMSGISFTGKSVGYDGETHSIEISGTLPEGVTVSYEGNGVNAAGKHKVVAKFTGDSANYEPIPDMEAYIELIEGKIPGISFTGKTVVFNGETQSLSIEGNLPEGTTVEYEGNGQRNVGTYTVTAKFYKNGVYDEKADLTATLEINKAKINVTASNATKIFNGQKQSIEIKGTAPFGVTVVVEGNGKIAPGVYPVTVKFVIDDAEKDNIEPKENLNLTLTIKASSTTATTGLVFEKIDGKNAYEVTGYEGNASFIIIPSLYQSLPVTSIASEAFKGNTSFSYVLIPDSVTNIGNNAFADCTALTDVTMSSKVTVIGQNAFKNTALTEIILPDTLTSIGFAALAGTKLERITLPFIGGSQNTATSTSSNRYLGFIFGATGYAAQFKFVPETLKTVTLSAACTEIPEYALYSCLNIEKVNIGSGVKIIGISALQGCTGIKSIFIPKTVETIPGNAYAYNSSFFACSADLVIVMEATSVKDYTYTETNSQLHSGTGFGQYWNVLSTDGENVVKAETIFGKTLAQYNELTK